MSYQTTPPKQYSQQPPTQSLAQYTVEKLAHVAYHGRGLWKSAQEAYFHLKEMV